MSFKHPAHLIPKQKEIATEVLPEKPIAKAYVK